MQGDPSFMLLERRFPWSFLGCVMGVAFGVFGIYSIFFYEKAPDLQLEILSNAPVFDLREEVQDLEVTFKGEDIRESRQALSLLTFKLANRGNTAITGAAFDARAPFVLSVKRGRLVRADILDASGEYYEKVFSEMGVSDDELTFPPFIMEPTDFLIAKMLILHREDDTPYLEARGKIANMQGVTILTSADQSESRGKVSPFAGDSDVQFLRVITYGPGTIAGVALVIGIVWLLKRTSESLAERMRMRIRWERGERVLAECDLATRTILRLVREAVVRDPRVRNRVGYMGAKASQIADDVERGACVERMLRRVIEETGRVHEVPDIMPRELLQDSKFLGDIQRFLRALR